MTDLKKFLYKGAYTLLALDHRGSLFRVLQKKGVEDPEEAAFEFKKQVLLALSEGSSGVLLDPKIGLKAWEEIEGKKPYLLCLEKSGYEEVQDERVTSLEYSPEQLKKLGASAAKLLLYFNPNYKASKLQLETGKRAVQECKKAGLPLFLEIVVYKKERGEVEDGHILSSLKAFLEAGIYPQVFKLQPPKSFKAAKEITSLLKPLRIDWIVLTQGVEFKVFQERLKQAVLAGCKGFLAGRSIWQEGVGLKGKELKEFLETTALARFKKIVSIATEA